MPQKSLGIARRIDQYDGNERRNAGVPLQIDETDRALIAALSENARLPTADLARKLGLARSTVQARLDRLVARGAIAGFTIKPGAGLRAPLRATVLICIEPRAAPAVLSRLRTMPVVETVHTTSGRVDMIVQLSAGTTEELDATLDRIGEAQGVRSSESLIHLSTKIDRTA
ncbi:transcriptional regulator, AsnC family [Citreimonas salinaria]|uniref:Transcriptional regulator, AsnC family n=1 Tax=Citreimonas salinaria TaxID=321339 RepID=A0A1H3JZC1_9RHOB|nr:transcriptional regulator, AsnC family [Citreimonas salinaria]